MRDNARVFLHGDKTMPGQGEWVIYRYYDHSKLSKFWDPSKDQAIGGPKYEYTEFLLRMLRDPIGAAGENADRFETQGWISNENEIALILWDLEQGVPKFPKPKEEDLIFRLKDGGQLKKPKHPRVRTDKYQITSLVESSGDYGRAEAWLLRITNAANIN